MATRKAGGKPFQKGQSGNPKGSSAKAQDIHLGRIKRLTNAHLAEVGSMLLADNEPAVFAMAHDPKQPFLKSWMATLLMKSKEDADPRIFNAILDRIVGKAKESVELTGADGKPVSLDMATRAASDDELLARAQVLFAQRQEAGDD